MVPTSPNNGSNKLQGWTSSPHDRGSFDILWTCLTTIFLSTWSAICLNVPEPDDTAWKHLERKIWLTLVSIWGPEFLLIFALGEWQSARESVVHLRQLRRDERWTMKHAFFADMGGFMLKTSDDCIFFLDTKHIKWLLEHDVISNDQFERDFVLNPKSIDDRNKSDIIVRVIAVGQALWFCVNIIARGVQGLAVTTLEVTTIGIIIDSILVYCVWKDKPADVQSTTTISIKKTLHEVIELEEDEIARTQAYFRTPLDFVSRKAWSINLAYRYLLNMLRCWPLTRRKRAKLPARRSETDILSITDSAFLTSSLATAAFLGTNFIAWSFHFPTTIERLLWRLSSCGLITIFLTTVLGLELVYNSRGITRMQINVRHHRRALEGSNVPGSKAKWTQRSVHKMRIFAMKIRNNAPDNDPNLDVSITFVLATVFSCTIYTVFRLYILVEDVIAFRGLPNNAYRTVNWSAFFPHLT